MFSQLLSRITTAIADYMPAMKKSELVSDFLLVQWNIKVWTDAEKLLHWTINSGPWRTFGENEFASFDSSWFSPCCFICLSKELYFVAILLLSILFLL